VNPQRADLSAVNDDDELLDRLAELHDTATAPTWRRRCSSISPPCWTNSPTPATGQ